MTNYEQSEAAIARALHEIADAYEQAGRVRAADSIRRKAFGLEASTLHTEEPSEMRHGPT